MPPHRWFSEFYAEIQTWAPPGFRDWPEYEDKAARLSEWSPGIGTGMLQTEGYARGLLETATGATAGIVAARLASRMERQKRVLFRDEDPPQAVYLVDHAALYQVSSCTNRLGASPLCRSASTTGGSLFGSPEIDVPSLTPRASLFCSADLNDGYLVSAGLGGDDQGEVIQVRSQVPGGGLYRPSTFGEVGLGNARQHGQPATEPARSGSRPDR